MLWAAVIFLLIFGLSLIGVAGLIAALPATYFADERHLWVDRHPVVRWLGIAAKKLLGLAIIGLGVVLAMPGVPGQGLLTILIGLMLLDVPGKHRLVQRIVRQPGVLHKLNSLRAWFGRPPLTI